MLFLVGHSPGVGYHLCCLAVIFNLPENNTFWVLRFRTINSDMPYPQATLWLLLTASASATVLNLKAKVICVTMWLG